MSAETSLADTDLTGLDRWEQGVPYAWFELLGIKRMPVASERP